MKNRWSIGIGLLIGSLITYSCANVIAPDGGPKDTTPPIILNLEPADSQLNIKPKKITARFNKFMEVKDLNSQMTISPLLDIMPTVLANGKRIEITLVDSLLRPNTTYKIDFGNAITDNREYTPVEDFTYVFSTGSFFDSLSLEGVVLDALTGLPDTSATVLLYDANLPDSQIVTNKPIYVSKVDVQGKFKIDILPNLDFKLFALQDVDNNYLYSPGVERIGFISKTINPTEQPILEDAIYTFLEEDSLGNAKKLALEAEAKQNKKTKLGQAPAGKKQDQLGYIVKADTTSIDSRTFDIKNPLLIQLLSPNASVDKEKIHLSYDVSGIEAEAVTEMRQIGDSILLSTQWQEDKVYTLRLFKGWAKDSAQNELFPGKYCFRTKGKQDYSNLTVNFPDSLAQQNYIAIIKSEKDTVYYGNVAAQIKLPLLNPTNYTIFIFKDENNDKVWTTGDYKIKRAPELMIPHDGTILLRAGWDNEIDYKPYQFTTGTRSKKPKFGVPQGINE